MSTSKLIRELREQSGATQAEIAAKLDIARATYAALEEGREPKLGEIRKLSELYQISPNELVEGKIAPETNYLDTTLPEIEPDILPREINPRVNPRKLRDVLLYLTNKVGAKANVGETVIYKLLYFIDFDFYEKTGRSITGLTYVKNLHGPTPKTSTFSGITHKMIENGELEIATTEYFSHEQKKYLPRKRLEEIDLTSLTARELEHINWEIDRLSDKTATELSRFSHDDTPWLVAKTNEPLDYQFVFYRSSKTTVAEPEDEL
jgi:transcriptional regulator with XRE-family HTH domain